MDNLRILLAAGGTGGHVYPAIAIADAIKQQNPDAVILFVGTKDHMEWQAVPKAGYKIKGIWISGFHRRFTFKNVMFPLKLAGSLVQSFNIIKSFKPHVMVSCGGYASGPIGWMAGKTGIPVVLQEQNSYPGVTNRLLAKFAVKIFTAFKEADQFLPEEKTELTGNPTRSELTNSTKEEGLKSFNFTSEKPVLLILGGSGGAKTINESIRQNLDRLHHEIDLQIIWQCGKRYIDDLAASINQKDYPNLRLAAYLDNMPEAYAAADLVISRAGASSCSELMITGKPSILVPSPNVAGDHQTMNAKSMADADASVLIKDVDMNKTISDLVNTLIRDQERLQKMNQAALKLAKPEAAQLIAKEILEIAQSRLDGK